MNSSAGKQAVQCYIGDTPRPTCNSTELNEEQGEEESEESTFCFCHTGAGQFENLTYRFHWETSDDGSIKDVYDGELYKMFSGRHGFLASATNISLLGNTDGALIHSSSYGVWPVFLVINELSPLQLNNWAIINNTSVWGLTNYFRRIIKTLIPRFSRKNRIFAELWFGKGKPHLPTFLQPFGLSLRMLYNPGKISSFQIYVHGATL